MKKQPSTIQSPIPRPKGENTALFLKSDVVDMVAVFINAMKNARGENGIKIFLSDERIVFKLDTSKAALGGGYRGEYDSTQTYKSGDIVRLSPTNEAFEEGVTIAGTYGTATDVGAGEVPYYPEDESSKWELIAPFPQIMQGCDAEGLPIDVVRSEQEMPEV